MGKIFYGQEKKSLLKTLIYKRGNFNDIYNRAK